jgi:hypothetical protein
MVVARSSKMLLPTLQSTRHYNLEDERGQFNAVFLSSVSSLKCPFQNGFQLQGSVVLLSRGGPSSRHT